MLFIISSQNTRSAHVQDLSSLQKSFHLVSYLNPPKNILNIKYSCGLVMDKINTNQSLNSIMGLFMPKTTLSPIQSIKAGAYKITTNTHYLPV